MATITKNNTFSAGAVIVASEHNDNFDTIYNDYNGNITTANIAAGAAIVDTQLAQISTASKVNMTALVETSEAAGDLLFRDGTNWSRLGIGSIASVIAADTGSGFPYWASLAAIAPVGSMVQQVNVRNADALTTSTAIAIDNSIPQQNEGGPFLIRAITPMDTGNSLRIDVVMQIASDGASGTTVALFQDGTADAIFCTGEKISSTDELQTVSFHHIMAAGTISETIFKVRAGREGAGSLAMNATTGGTREYGGRGYSEMTITEIKA